jgi:hypothetical protein
MRMHFDENDTLIIIIMLCFDRISNPIFSVINGSTNPSCVCRAEEMSTIMTNLEQANQALRNDLCMKGQTQKNKVEPPCTFSHARSIRLGP